jgi:hypothetical protein
VAHVSANSVERGDQNNIEAMSAGICRKAVQAETFRPRVSSVGKPRCKLRCKLRAQTSPEEQGCDQIERIENKHDGEYQLDS